MTPGLVMVAVFASMLAAQTAPAPELYSTPGRVLARGQNTIPDGFYRLKTYRIEEVRLARPVAATVAGTPRMVDRAFRVILVGESFPVRALPPVIWAGDILVGRAQESRDLTEVVAVTFDASIIGEGATLGLSFGETGEREVLREPIRYAVAP